MASCRACGHPNLLWVTTAYGERIPLEPQVEVSGPDRYKLLDVAERTAAPVSAEYRMEAYPNHRPRCPRS